MYNVLERSGGVPGHTEVKTRQELIDPALKRAGWDVADPNQVGLEIPVDGFDPAAWQALQAELRRVSGGQASYQAPLPAGISDYALYRPNGEIIGVVEAKRTSTDPRLAQTQAEFYVSEIAKRQSFRPFAFVTNGEQIYFLEDLTVDLTGFRNLSGRSRNEEDMATKTIPDEIKQQADVIVANFNKTVIRNPKNFYVTRYRGQHLYLDRYDHGQLGHVCRLKFSTGLTDWDFAIYKYSDERYDAEEWFFPGAEYLDGTIEGAMRAGLKAYA